MIPRIRWAMVLGLLLFNIGMSNAQGNVSAPVHRAIPFKADTATLEDQSIQTALVLVSLLVIATLGLHFLRRRVPGLSLKGTRLKVVERANLNARCTLYLVTLDQREVLLAHCGDSVTLMNIDSQPLAAEQVSEISNA